MSTQTCLVTNKDSDEITPRLPHLQQPRRRPRRLVDVLQIPQQVRYPLVLHAPRVDVLVVRRARQPGRQRALPGLVDERPASPSSAERPRRRQHRGRALRRPQYVPVHRPHDRVRHGRRPHGLGDRLLVAVVSLLPVVAAEQRPRRAEAPQRPHQAPRRQDLDRESQEGVALGPDARAEERRRRAVGHGAEGGGEPRLEPGVREQRQVQPVDGLPKALGGVRVEEEQGQQGRGRGGVRARRDDPRQRLGGRRRRHGPVVEVPRPAVLLPPDVPLLDQRRSAGDVQPGDVPVRPERPGERRTLAVLPQVGVDHHHGRDEPDRRRRARRYDGAVPPRREALQERARVGEPVRHVRVEVGVSPRRLRERPRREQAGRHPEPEEGPSLLPR
ncbi:hypothetical protein THAOC_25618 [Thalassiosira oceanica]|uniref:Uncharacterized protein n=1 Tax=Thalassiosira oceanica TaxID=159749 RepID=K0RNW9_THAOC|nr:hypothetical protein THAOC_25618 [Thalassiosira oceanica]|eukprot:EJK54730.1 hypothetical protein THAOC_25618 [Thalassiosira oceanica]